MTTAEREPGPRGLGWKQDPEWNRIICTNLVAITHLTVFLSLVLRIPSNLVCRGLFPVPTSSTWAPLEPHPDTRYLRCGTPPTSHARVPHHGRYGKGRSVLVSPKTGLQTHL